jgi:hypothetical protein
MAQMNRDHRPFFHQWIWRRVCLPGLWAGLFLSVSRVRAATFGSTSNEPERSTSLCSIEQYVRGSRSQDERPSAPPYRPAVHERIERGERCIVSTYLVHQESTTCTCVKLIQSQSGAEQAAHTQLMTQLIITPKQDYYSLRPFFNDNPRHAINLH